MNMHTNRGAVDYTRSIQWHMHVKRLWIYGEKRCNRNSRVVGGYRVIFGLVFPGVLYFDRPVELGRRRRFSLDSPQLFYDNPAPSLSVKIVDSVHPHSLLTSVLAPPELRFTYLRNRIRWFLRNPAPTHTSAPHHPFELASRVIR